MTYLWQEESRNRFYKVQTDDVEIYRILKRRNNFKLTGVGWNCDLWIFNCEFSRPDIAKKILKSVTGKNVNIDLEGVSFCGE